jgi:hypothetical protein
MCPPAPLTAGRWRDAREFGGNFKICARRRLTVCTAVARVLRSVLIADT